MPPHFHGKVYSIQHTHTQVHPRRLTTRSVSAAPRQYQASDNWDNTNAQIYTATRRPLALVHKYAGTQSGTRPYTLGLVRSLGLTSSTRGRKGARKCTVAVLPGVGSPVALSNPGSAGAMGMNRVPLAGPPDANRTRHTPHNTQHTPHSTLTHSHQHLQHSSGRWGSLTTDTVKKEGWKHIFIGEKNTFAPNCQRCPA
jgi:hypothetical protein